MARRSHGDIQTTAPRQEARSATELNYLDDKLSEILTRQHSYELVGNTASEQLDPPIPEARNLHSGKRTPVDSRAVWLRISL